MWAQDTSKVVVVHAIYKRTRALPLHRWLHPSVSVSRGTDRSAGKLRIATPNSRHICTCRALLSRGLARTSSRSRRCSQRHAFSGATVLFTSSTLYTLSLFALVRLVLKRQYKDLLVHASARATASCLGLQMLFAPRRRSTVGLMQSDWIFVPLSAMYITLLLQSWTPDTLQLIMPGSLQAGLSGSHCMLMKFTIPATQSMHGKHPACC